MKNTHMLFQKASLEARATGENGFFGHFVKQMSNLLEKIGLFTDKVQTVAEANQTNEPLKRANKDLAETSYTGLRKRTVYAPKRLSTKATMVELIDVVKECLEAQEDIEKNVLNPWRGYVAGLLTNPAELGQLNNLDKVKFTDLEKLHKKLDKVIDGDLDQPTREFGAIYRNYKEWGQTCDRYNKLLETFSHSRLSRIAKEVKELQKLTNQLVDRIEEEPEVYAASPATLKTLAEGAYLMGLELEFYAMMTDQLNAINGALDNTVQRISGH